MTTRIPAPSPASPTADEISTAIRHHIVSNLGYDAERSRKENIYRGLAYTVRDYLIERWIGTQQEYYNQGVKRVYYLSLEFLPGPFLVNNILNLGMRGVIEESLRRDFGFSLEEVAVEEWEPGLGNGGLGRLASCYLDSMATLKVPGYGYGIRYAYGIFQQEIRDGWQVEQADPWLRFGTIWEFDRPQNLYEVHFGGRVVERFDGEGIRRFEWIDTDRVMAMACDILVPGYRNGYVSNMRLWAAKANRGFNLAYFNTGDYVGAMQDNIRSENISMVLYPNDESEEGKELRFRQQYFLVSATLQDIMRRHKKNRDTYRDMPGEAVIQLNETHPAIAIPELMRILLDTERMPWEEAWDVCVRIFAYTNHTVLPEALEKWPVNLVARLLPRHLQIIYEINRRFLDEVARRWPDGPERLSAMSLIEEGPVRYIRMAHLAIVGSHSVNGVARLHTDIIKETLFRDFTAMYPARFNNKTNGITPRRFLLQANPSLSALITDAIGESWVTRLDELAKLRPLADDAAFRGRWMAERRGNKERLAAYVRSVAGIDISPAALIDVQVKRIHEYKRQLMNILHVVSLYRRIRENPGAVATPRAVIFGGKAAPGYHMAKKIIRLITAVADTVNGDPAARDLLSVVFLPNYNVSLNERLITAADLSEQISTAGMEASGTGNMKFALNGALTIGTLDGANVEIREEVGAENFFLFGLTAEEVTRRRRGGYEPRAVYETNPELKDALDAVAGGAFLPEDPGLFRDIVSALLDRGDYFMVCADYADYREKQDEAARCYADTDEWARRSILNTAGMGKFSSDRAVLEYARDIWQTTPLR